LDAARIADVQPVDRTSQMIDLASATLMAAATVATAWCGYQSALWGGEEVEHNLQASSAIVRAGKFANLAEQKMALHTNLFFQWTEAITKNNATQAGFLFDRLPDPLKAATAAWRATKPFSNPDAPATPFDTPEYALAETAEAARWEDVVIAESTAAIRASHFSDRYLLFTIIFASVLFFAGISGKFSWRAVDVTVLALGILTLMMGLLIMLALPRASRALTATVCAGRAQPALVTHALASFSADIVHLRVPRLRHSVAHTAGRGFERID
jgi:hypothetical protein